MKRNEKFFKNSKKCFKDHYVWKKIGVLIVQIN